MKALHGQYLFINTHDGLKSLFCRSRDGLFRSVKRQNDIDNATARRHQAKIEFLSSNKELIKMACTILNELDDLDESCLLSDSISEAAEYLTTIE